MPRGKKFKPFTAASMPPGQASLTMFPHFQQADQMVHATPCPKGPYQRRALYRGDDDLPSGQSIVPGHYWTKNQLIDDTIKNNPCLQFQEQAMQLRIAQQSGTPEKTYHGTYNTKHGFWYSFYSYGNYSYFEAYDPLTMQRVGQAEVGTDEGRDANFLSYIEVEPPFRRRGIGMQLIRIINDSNKHPDTGMSRFMVVIGSPQQHTSHYPQSCFLHADGKKLIDACRKAGILKLEQLILPTPDPSPAYYPMSPPHPGLKSPPHPGCMSPSKYGLGSPERGR